MNCTISAIHLLPDPGKQTRFVFVMASGGGTVKLASWPQGGSEENSSSPQKDWPGPIFSEERSNRR